MSRALSMMLALLLGGCGGHLPPTPASYESSREAQLLTEILGGPDDRINPVDPLILDEGIRRYIDAHVDRTWSNRAKIVALRKMMFAPDDLNIQYDSTRTQTAIETFQSRRGNCLSMTNLYVAAARYLKVDANYQVVALNPTWEKTGAVMIRNEHINAIGRLSGIGKYVVDFRPNITFRDKDTQTISDREAVALYYTNLGAESIVAGEPDAAVRYIRSALAITPESADAWNNMGAAARRLGRFEQAEFSYQRAVHLDPYHYTAMNNLGRLYRGRGDLGREKHYLDRVKRYRAKHPYYLYFEARRAYQRNDLLAARKYLKRAIYRKRDDPEFYVALSNVYRQLGDQRRSDINMRKAEEYRKAVPQYDHEQEMDLLVDGPIMSIQYKVTRIPDG